MTCKEKLTRAEVKVEHLQQQTETLRTMQARLAHEKEALMKDQQSQNKLQASLQAIQVHNVTCTPLKNSSNLSQPTALCCRIEVLTL